MQSRNREVTVTPHRRGEAASLHKQLKGKGK